jgi:electron-transferring-flavoprotein dehydrogenase
LYHQEPNLVLAGLVVGLDYANPFLNPYKEFQKWKTHPAVSKHFKGGTCISYGARVLNEGGYHSIPKVTFPGGALIGCAAGFLNAVKIKGSHTALKSGMLAAEAVFDGLQQGEAVAETGELDQATHQPQELTDYTQKLESSWIYQELYQVRNCHQAFSKWGVGGGLAYSGFATHISKGKEPWTLGHEVGRDADTTQSLDTHKERDYPAPDGKLTFDLLTNLQRSGTFHEVS